MKFKVGDRVKYVAQNWTGMSFRKMKGTVIGIKGDIISVEFDEPFAGGHDGCGFARGKYGHCWNCQPKALELINNSKIVITVNGNETIARMFEGDKCVNTAIAKCNPSDEFDFKTGAKLAFERLFEEKHAFEKGKRYIFDRKTFEKVEGVYTKNYGWVNKCDGKIVNVETGLRGTINGFGIKPKWCIEAPAFKVGDRVRIRDWNDMEKEFGHDACGNIDVPFKFTEHMKHLCGRTATIKDLCRNNRVILDFDDKSDVTLWSFSPEMLELVTFDWDKFGKHELFVLVTKDNFKDFVSEAKKHGFVFDGNEDFNPFMAKRADSFMRMIMPDITIKPDEIYIVYEGGSLRVAHCTYGNEEYTW